MAITRIWDADASKWVVVGSDSTDHVVDPVEPVSPSDGLLWTNPLDDGISDSPGGLGAGWINYVPVLTAEGGTPLLGNALVSARYSLVGNTVSYRVDIELGSTTNFGTGIFRLSTPKAPANTGGYPVHGLGYAYDASTGNMLTFMVQQEWDLPKVHFVKINSSPAVNTHMTSTYPWTWAATDTLGYQGSYEVSV